jgi:hypothetical protein
MHDLNGQVGKRGAGVERAHTRITPPTHAAEEDVRDEIAGEA